MPKIAAPKALRAEDFTAEEKKLIEKIASSVNPFQDDVFRILNGGLDYTNMNRQLVEGVDIRINAAGTVINSPSVKLDLNGTPKGVYVISAQNQINSTTYPTTAPFVSWTLKDGQLIILNVTGLQASSRYLLNLEIVA